MSISEVDVLWKDDQRRSSSFRGHGTWQLLYSALWCVDSPRLLSGQEDTCKNRAVVPHLGHELFGIPIAIDVPVWAHHAFSQCRVLRSHLNALRILSIQHERIGDQGLSWGICLEILFSPVNTPSPHVLLVLSTSTLSWAYFQPKQSDWLLQNNHWDW